MLIDQILTGIEAEENGRQWGNPLRMSSAGKCQRSIAYQLHGFEPKPLRARARMVFRLGDTVEAEIKALIQKYPPKGFEIEYPEAPIEIEIAGRVITGHVDGLILKPKLMILEIKSINTRGFSMLASKGISYGYQCQATLYMKALGYEKTLFIFYNKDTSHLTEIPYEFDDEMYEYIVERFTNVIGSGKESLPDREYEPNEKGVLGFQCNYCAFVDKCWSEAKLKIDSYGRPKYVIEKKEAENE